MLDQVVACVAALSFLADPFALLRGQTPPAPADGGGEPKSPAVSRVLPYADTWLRLFPEQPQTPAICLVLSPKLALDSRSSGLALMEIRTIWASLGVLVRAVDEPDELCQRVIVVRADVEARPEDAAAPAPLVGYHSSRGMPASWCS